MTAFALVIAGSNSDFAGATLALDVGHALPLEFKRLQLLPGDKPTMGV